MDIFDCECWVCQPWVVRVSIIFVLNFQESLIYIWLRLLFYDIIETQKVCIRFKKINLFSNNNLFFNIFFLACARFFWTWLLWAGFLRLWLFVSRRIYFFSTVYRLLRLRLSASLFWTRFLFSFLTNQILNKFLWFGHIFLLIRWRMAILFNLSP